MRCRRRSTSACKFGVSAELERENLVRRVGELAVDRLAGADHDHVVLAHRALDPLARRALRLGLGRLGLRSDALGALLPGVAFSALAVVVLRRAALRHADDPEPLVATV